MDQEPLLVVHEEDVNTRPEPDKAEDADLVRVYLNRIGRRRLLDPDEQRAVCTRIETARADMFGAMAVMPSVIARLATMAARIENGSLDADDLIVLPDGSPLQPEKATEILGVLARLGRLERRILKERRQLAAETMAATTRRTREASIARAERRLSEDLRIPPDSAGARGATPRRAHTPGAAPARGAGPAAVVRPGPGGRRRRRGDWAADGPVPGAFRSGPRVRVGARRAQERADRGQPPPGGVDRAPPRQSRSVAARPDPGRQHRLDEGGRSVPGAARLPVLHLCDVVDPAGDHQGGRGRTAAPFACPRTSSTR